MALEDILHRIQKEAQQAAGSITAEADKQAESIIVEAQQQADKLKQKLWEKIRKQIEEKKQQKLTMVRLECRKQFLQEKESQIENAFSNAMDYLTSLNDTDYLDLVNKLLLSAVKPNEDEAAHLAAAVCVNKERRQLIDEVLKGVNAKIGSSLHLSPQDASIKGGFILQYERHELNYSFEAMLHHVREDITRDVAEILFQ
ncbi:MAG: V-type ATP synthase subunit E family protein [bacterium]